MSLKYLICLTLICLSFSLKETIFKYKAMSELNPPLKNEVCKFINREEEVIYLKPCEKGYHCGEEANDISICVPNNILKKLGEECNFDNECLAGHCENNKCSFSEADKPYFVENEEIYRCGCDLFYLNDEKSCKNKTKFNYLENFCTYTKNSESSNEVSIEPIKPFYLCGESGTADEKEPNLKPGSHFIKISKIGELKNGVQSEHEYTCETGFRSVFGENLNLICDDVKQIVRKGINEEGLAFAEYIFEKAGHINITEKLYESGFFYRNYFTGELEPYDEIYIKAFKEYVSVLKKNEDKCLANSHDYYFNPLHCGIKEVYDAYFYLNHMCLYSNKTKEAQMIVDYLKNQEFQELADERTSNSLILKYSFLGLISILLLF